MKCKGEEEQGPEWRGRQGDRDKTRGMGKLMRDTKGRGKKRRGANEDEVD